MSGIPAGWSVVPANQVPADWKVVPAGQEQAPPQDPELRAQLEAQEEGARGEGELNPANVKPDISPGATFFEHAGNKAGFGIVPALTGAATALEIKREGDTRPFADIYRNAVQGTKQDLSRGEMLNPTAATAGKGAGIASTLLLPAGRAAQGLGAAARTAAGAGAIYGGVGGLAGGKGLETLNPGRAALDTAVGAGTGAATGAVLGPVASAAARGISPVARYIGGKLQNLSEESALKAVGLIGSNRRALYRQNPDLPERVAAALGKEGVIKPFSTVEGNVGRLLDAQESANQGVGSALKTVNDRLEMAIAEASAKEGAAVPQRFNTANLTGGIHRARAALEDTPGVAQPSLDAIRSMEESIARGGPKEMSLPEANALKSSLQEQARSAYRSGAQSQVTRAMKAVPRTAREYMLETAGQVPGGREQVEGALARATPLNAIADEASERAQMMAGHSSLGHIGGQMLGGAIGGMIGAGGHGALGPAGIVAGLAQKGLRQRASSLGATAGLAGANAMEGLATAGEKPVARYIAGLLSSGTRRLSPGLEGSAGEAGDHQFAGGGTRDPRHP